MLSLLLGQQQNTTMKTHSSTWARSKGMKSERYSEDKSHSCSCYDCLRRDGITINGRPDCLGLMRDRSDGRYLNGKTKLAEHPQATSRSAQPRMIYELLCYMIELGEW